MTKAAPVFAALGDLISEWDQVADTPLDTELFSELLADLIFHGDHRFLDYKPHPSSGSYPSRLLSWLGNVSRREDQQTLLRMARFVDFMGNRELNALYVDSYRRIIKPWILSNTGRDVLYLFDTDAEFEIRSVLGTYAITSVTLSFSLPMFVQVNELTDLPIPIVLGDTPSSAETQVRTQPVFKRAQGCIIMEDFVGTGSQAGDVVNTVARLLPNIPIIFVPLVCLERGVRNLRDALADRIRFDPVLTIPSNRCVGPDSVAGEPLEFPIFRRLIRSTASAVRSRANRFDAVPSSAFGYADSGALYVSSHNAPNNTIPLIHHRGKHWDPLFRRHHSKRNKKMSSPAPKYEDGLR